MKNPFRKVYVSELPKSGPAFLILRTSTMCDVPISHDDVVQFGEPGGIEQLIEWCRDQKFPVLIHANGFDNGEDSTDYPVLQICDGRE